MALIQRIDVTKSIGGKIALAFLVTLIITCLSLCGMMYTVANNIMNNYVMTQFDIRLNSDMQSLLKMVPERLVAGALTSQKQYQILLARLNQFKHSTNGVQNAYVISKVNGEDVILALSDDNKYMYKLPFTAEQNESLSSDKPVLSAIYSDAWGVHKSLFVPYPAERSVVGIDMDAYFTVKIHQFILFSTIGSILGVLILGTVVSYFLGRAFSKPIRKLVSFNNELARGNLSVPPLVPKTRDEIAELINSTNTR